MAATEAALAPPPFVFCVETPPGSSIVVVLLNQLGECALVGQPH